jgi:hypothetical protein
MQAPIPMASNSGVRAGRGRESRGGEGAPGGFLSQKALRASFEGSSLQISEALLFWQKNFFCQKSNLAGFPKRFLSEYTHENTGKVRIIT